MIWRWSGSSVSIKWIYKQLWLREVREERNHCGQEVFMEQVASGWGPDGGVGSVFGKER